MNTRRFGVHHEKGFTIVELLVVIAVIAILAAITIVGYGTWRKTTLQNAVKSDLTVVMAAMENARTFNNVYPLAVPSSFTPSSGVAVTFDTSSTNTSYCIDGKSTQDATIVYFAESLTKDKGPQAGTCATRPIAPVTPTGLAVVSTTEGQINLSWDATSGAATYNIQCALTTGYSTPGTAVSSSTTGSVTGRTASTPYYCRVNATNPYGTSPWSASIVATTAAISYPSGLAAGARTGTSIAVSWTANADAVSYTIQCSKDSGFGSGVLSQSIPVPTVSATFSGLTLNAAYYCRVNSVSASNTSAWSPNLTTSTTDAYGTLAVASSIEGYWTSAPVGYLIEDGSAVSRSTYSSLFAVIGTTYGAGNGSTTFNLPDSRGRTVVNKSTDTEFTTIGQTVGTKVETLTTAQIPAHAHDLYMKYSGSVTYGEIGMGDFSATGSPTGVQGPIQATGGGGSHNNIQPSIVKMFAIKYASVDSSAATLPAGSSMSGYWSSVPTGSLLEDGSAVSRTTYSALFSAIGTTYGAGDGSTTFNLPDSRGRATVNKNSSDTEFDTMGKKYGEKAHILTITELPSHSHLLRVKNPGAATYGEVGGGDSSSGTGATVGGTIQNAGGGGSHNEIQPSIVQLFAIKFTAATGSTPVDVGTSVDGYWASAPSGYLIEDGAAVSRSTYSDLFATIGTTYGVGNGSSTFNLPDSRGRTGVNLNSSDTEFDTMGEKYGTKAHLLTIAEMPSHTHPIRVKNAGTGTYGETAGGDASATGATVTGPVRPTGGGLAHNNIQPSIVKLTVIKF